MERIWLTSYPAGVPADVDPTRLRSIKELLERTCAAQADRVANNQKRKNNTKHEHDELSRAFAAWLQLMGFKKGDRLAIMLPNTLQYPIALFGALRAGLVVVNTNPLYTARELRHQLEDSGAKAILVLDNFASTLQEVIDETHVERVITTGIGDLLGFPKGALVNFVIKHVKKMVPAYSLPNAVRFRDALAQGASHPMPKVHLGHDDLAFLQYTGGTTGV